MRGTGGPPSIPWTIQLDRQGFRETVCETLRIGFASSRVRFTGCAESGIDCDGSYSRVNEPLKRQQLITGALLSQDELLSWLKRANLLNLDEAEDRSAVTDVHHWQDIT